MCAAAPPAPVCVNPGYVVLECAVIEVLTIDGDCVDKELAALASGLEEAAAAAVLSGVQW